MLLVEKILAGHNELWFNKNFAQNNRPERASITTLQLKNESAEITEAAFNDLGRVYKGEVESKKTRSVVIT